MSDASKTLIFWLLAGVLLASPPASAQSVGAQNTAPLPPRPPSIAPVRPATAPARPVTTPPAANRVATPSRPSPARVVPLVAPPRQPHAQRPPAARAAPTPAIIAPPALPPPPEPVIEPGKGSVTQMPIPRFAALKSDEVNLRTGPGQRYPVDWVYRRRDLPVQIEREFDVWRLIRDPEGTKGWVHQATLTGRRTFFVLGGERAIHRAASEDATVIARLKPGVVGVLRRCEAQATWCQVQVGEHKGWLKRSDFWGILANEAVN